MGIDEAVVGDTVEAVLPGGRSEAKIPPPFIRHHRQPMPFRCRRKAVSGAFVAAESHAPSQSLFCVHTNRYHSQ